MAATARAGNWLPDKEDVKRHVANILKKVKESPPNPEAFLHTYILELKQLIETDPEVNMLFTTMFTQDAGDPLGGSSLCENYTQLLFAMNYIMTIAPQFGVPFPLHTLLLYPGATPSGTVAFLNDKVSQCFRKILRNWAQLLNNPDSRYVLNQQDGWLSDAALKQMPGFKETYVTDPCDEYWGFKSWNDFFARKLLPGVRPVDGASDTLVITSPCESVPYILEKNPQFRDTFWIKEQPYSLQHMLNDEPIAESYVGGSVYQAYLSPMIYHRWHVPVDSKVIKAYVVNGAYYAQALSCGFDPTSGTYSQSYLTNVATRAIITFEADDANVGIVTFIAIGMSEIASVVIDLFEGQRVRKGDPMGTFQFGGSSFVLLFQRGVKVNFVYDPIPKDAPLVLVNKQIANVIPKNIERSGYQPQSGNRCPVCKN